MKIKGFNIAIVSLACLTVIALAGSSVGTLAWYAYSTRATVAYSGTAVQEAEQLQIGLEWDTTRISETNRAAYKTKYQVSFEPVGNKTYCFMPSGKGFSSAAINEYLTLSGYATKELPPVTSRSYELGDALSLYESPTFGYPNNTNAASTTRYVHLPFAFRIMREVGGVLTPMKGLNIWLTDVTAAAKGEKDVKDALRMHISNQIPNADNAHKSFILNPAATPDTEDPNYDPADPGITYVGGILDLNGDGVYDYGDAKVNDVTRSVEYLYGECTVETGYGPSEFATTTYGNPNEAPGDATHLSTFVAKHAQSVYGYTDYAHVTRGEAEYLYFDQVRPQENNGTFSGGYPITQTSQDTGLGLATLTVWLEGWDHAIVDANIGAEFNLGLQFEINRV